MDQPPSNAPQRRARGHEAVLAVTFKGKMHRTNPPGLQIPKAVAEILDLTGAAPVVLDFGMPGKQPLAAELTSGTEVRTRELLQFAGPGEPFVVTVRRGEH